MKLLACYCAISEKEVGWPVLEQLWQLYPPGRYLNTFNCCVPADDKLSKELDDVLHAEGYRPGKPLQKICPSEYSFHFNRIYDRYDIDATKFLVFRAPEIDGLHREWPAPAELVYGRIRDGIRIGSGTAHAIFAVREDVKRALEAADLRGVHLTPLKISEKAVADEPYWELSSNIVLPRLAPTTEFVDSKGRPFSGDYNEGCYIREGFFNDPELHFTRSAIANNGNFDLAITRERFGYRDKVAYPRLVASKRFYDFCVAQKLKKMSWQPVRIDPD